MSSTMESLVAVLLIVQLFICSCVICKTDDDFKDAFLSGNFMFTVILQTTVEDIHPNVNYAVSPFALQSSMAMMLLSSTDETRHNIKQIMEFPQNGTALELNVINCIHDFLESFTHQDSIKISTAINAFIDATLTINPMILNMIRRAFQVNPQFVDFLQPETASSTINHWIEEHTNGRLPNLIGEENKLQTDDRLILASVMDISGEWLKPFCYTVDTHEIFNNVNGNTSVVPMMYVHGEFVYGTFSTLRFVSIPFADNFTQMVLFMEDSNTSAANEEPIEMKQKVLASLMNNSVEIDAEVSTSSDDFVYVRIPRFTLEFKGDAKRYLQEMGLKRAFSNDAEFPLFLKDKGQIFIDDITQMVQLSVNEAGVGVYKNIVDETRSENDCQYSGKPSDEHQLDFLANKPFEFHIVHKGVTLFVGKVYSL